MNRPRAIQSSGILALSAVLAGCSLGLFSDGRDEAVLKQQPYRPIAADCSRLDLGQGALSVPQFRGLLGCLGSNGALEPLQKLVAPVPDAELLPLVRVANEQFFSQPSVIYQVRQTHSQWLAGGRLGDELEAMGGLLRHEQVLPALLRLIRHADDRFFEALALLSRQGPELKGALEAAIALVDSPAFARLSMPLGERVSTAIHSALHSTLALRLDRSLLAASADGSLFRALDDFSRAQGLRGATSHLMALISRTAEGDAPRLNELSRLVHALRKPISCFAGARSMSDPVTYVLDSISGMDAADTEHFLRRRSVLQFSVAGSFCEYPAEFERYYPAFQDLASSDLLFTATELSTAFHRQGISSVILDALEGPLPELAPVLSELSRRDALGDFLLLFSLVPTEARPLLMSAARSLLVPRAELQGASLLEALRQPLTRLAQDDVRAVVEAAASMQKAAEPVLLPALKALRSVLLMNDAHPISMGLNRVLATPELSSAVVRTLARWSQERRIEFADAVGFVGSMTLKADGRLNEIMSAVFRVFSKSADHAADSGTAAKPRALEVAPLNPALLRAHSWSAGDLASVSPRKLSPRPGCDELTPGTRLDLVSGALPPQQLQAYLECLNAGGAQSELKEAVFDWLLAKRTPEGVPLLNLLIRHGRDLQLDRSATAELLDGLLGSGRPRDSWLSKFVEPMGDVRWSNAAAQLIAGVFGKPGDSPGTSGSQSLERLERVAGRVLRSDAFPPVFRAVVEAAKSGPASPAFSDSEEFPLQAFSPVLSRYECNTDARTQRRRADQLVADYRDAVVGWRIDPETLRPPHVWSKARLREDFLPLAGKLASPAQGTLAEGLLRFMSRFRDPQRLAELGQWLSVRANDWRVIPYFYPDEEQPTAKVVNSLDLLELLVINADFNFVLSENYALKFLTSVALAWGDEPRESWPTLVRSMFPSGRRPPTLREAYADILDTLELSEKFIGYPRLPDCRGGSGWGGVLPGWLKARVFNMRQTVAVISESLPGAPGPRSGGLKLLRDLLFEMYQSTPEHHRGYGDGWNNNLAAGAQLAKMGAFRQISRGLRLALLPENRSSLPGAVLQGMAEFSAAPMAPRLIRTALSASRPGEWPGEFVLSLMNEAERVLGDAERGPRLRNSVLHAVALLRTPGLAAPVARALEEVAGRARPELARVVGPALGLLGSAGASAFIEALSVREPVPALAELATIALGEGSPGAPVSLDAFRLFARAASPELGPFWDEMASRPLPEFVVPEMPALAGRLRQFFADRCDRNELTPYLRAAASDPAGTARLLQAVGKTSVSGDLEGLIADFMRALPSSRP